jgi:hypothetical protein
MLYKYACSIKSFPNCRVHDGGFDHGLRFFKNFDQVVKELIQTYQEEEYGDLYFVGTGAKVATISYEFQRHEFRKIEINRTQEFLEPEDDFEGGVISDNGYGKKEFKTWQEKHSVRA